VNSELVAGLVVSLVPLLIAGFLALRKEPGIFRFFVAMLLIGFGYLTMTGAINDIGAKVLGHYKEVPAAAAPAK
jgi:hypothetical protein